MALKYGGKLINDYSAMQGPCPDGFHIPSKNERSSLGEILITTFSMAESSTTAGTYLKMPLSGTISSMNGSSGNRGSSDTRYRSSSCYDYDSQNYIAYSVRMFSGYINFNESTNRSGGLAIRPFKDIPLIPDSNWTTLYDGSSVATGAGIFHNPTLGLISISGNGNTWITIADKNLGATTVYNQGDTTKDSNCGKYFQRGNNYGFTYGDTLTTSSTQIDASSYGPGNYYSSSTFILGGYFSSWDSSNNMNLRGGVTGVQQKPVDIVKRYYGQSEVIRVYYNTTKIRERTVPALCFTAEQASSSVTLNKVGTPTSVNIETSTNGSTWSDYSFGTAISLANIGDKVYFRNKSNTVTALNTGTSDRYTFSISGKAECDGDATYLLCRAGTDTLSAYCFHSLFSGCAGLTKAPELPATTLANYCYGGMFKDCTSLVMPPKLSATPLATSCYRQMFYGCTSLMGITSLSSPRLPQYCCYQMFSGCSKIKLSETQTGDYTQPYIITTSGGTTGSNALGNMFQNTGGTKKGTINRDTTYYLHKDNTIV